ncbi:FK506-binding protein-like [Sitophilus oryzae]|uniref:FK506-binding protein-like n=1 Tax=Sitophilus oryzae TaxID=7048 RepID=A0A6J2YUD5_SITOR|nr:FK506-binding protein-like [Sitophilus oryzae]
MEEWISPDDKIHKKVLVTGNRAFNKPFEESTFKLNISDCPKILDTFKNKTLTVGDSNGDLGRALDICVCTMHLNEKAQFTISLDLEQITAIIELIELDFQGFIYEWNAKKKIDIALKHKEKGTEFFNRKNQIEAAYRFTKALKILLSIPVDVQYPPEITDGIKQTELKALKGKLYNNLSSCYFREKVYKLAMPLCEKVLSIEPDNVKALYKIGVASEMEKDYDKAFSVLGKVMELEPRNKACAQHLASVKQYLKKADSRVNEMMRKMIRGSISK